MSQLTFSDLYTARDEAMPTRRVRWRLGICAVALFIGFVLSAVPVPYVTNLSVTQEVIRLYSTPTADHLLWIRPGEGFWTYFFVAVLVAFGLAQPVHIYQGLALVGPSDLGRNRQPRRSATLLLYVAFLTGNFVAHQWVLPTVISFWLTYGTDNIPGLEVKWAFSEYISTATGLSYLVGLAFQLPFWPAVLVRLGIVSCPALHRFRGYALLAVVIVAAWITPTTDLLSMTIVAAPLYLLYELGLLLAGLVPAESHEPTG